MSFVHFSALKEENKQVTKVELTQEFAGLQLQCCSINNLLILHICAI